MKAEATEAQLEKTRAHLQHKVNLFEEAATEVRACDMATLRVCVTCVSLTGYVSLCCGSLLCASLLEYACLRLQEPLPLVCLCA